MQKKFTGFDIGTESVKAVVTDNSRQILYLSEDKIHFGNPWGALLEIYEEMKKITGDEFYCAFTGSGGKSAAQKLKIPFYHDTISIPLGAGFIDPETKYIFHAGAKDSYFFEREISSFSEDNSGFVSDHSTGTKCGGGSGIMITKQCRRFFEKDFQIKNSRSRVSSRKEMQRLLERIYIKAENEARKAVHKINVGGRCGVVIQSDMIHLQNKGTNINEILYGLFKRTILNYCTDVLNKRSLSEKGKKIVSGGLFKNRLLVEILEEILGTEITIPEHSSYTGAIGAALKAQKQGVIFLPELISGVEKDEISKIKTIGPLSDSIKNIQISQEPQVCDVSGSVKFFIKPSKKNKKVILGLDGGSTTTKCILIDEENLSIIAESCIYTNGKPLEAAQIIFRDIKLAWPDIKVAGIAYTGSSGEFYRKIFSASSNNDSSVEIIDCVRDEITCHGLGVQHYNKNVDTIFELGGQDAKFTLFNSDGTVKKSKMNLSCMAGTGQTMQNMVEMIGMDIDFDFHSAALNAKRTPVVDDTCGVFTEAGIARLFALGLPKEEIAAAIAYGFIGGYVNKFIGTEKFGSFASAQGGPFKGKACLAALSAHTGMKIHAFPHRQLFGALGAALSIKNDIIKLKNQQKKFQTSFRGFDLPESLEKKEMNCSEVIQDSCSEKECRLEVFQLGKERLITGGACPKGNTEKKNKKAPDYTSIYKSILNRHLSKYSSTFDKKYDLENARKRILIPRSLSFLNGYGIFLTALYKNLGFEIMISPESDDLIANLGIKYSHSETCYPVKLAHGHGMFLKERLRKGIDKILLVNAISTENGKYKFCPYIASAGFLIKDAAGLSPGDVLLPALTFGRTEKDIAKSILKDLTRVYGNQFKLKTIIDAVKKADNASKSFKDEISLTGNKILQNLKKKNEKIFMSIGRGYTLFDNKAGSKVEALFSKYGFHLVPSLFFRSSNVNVDEITNNMYWVQGRTIIADNVQCAVTENVFPVRATNFNCGSDSMLITHEEEIIQRSAKPHLILQTDGHTSNAQFGTRALANMEVVKNYSPVKITADAFKLKKRQISIKNKIIGIPYMGDSSYVIAETFNAMGYKSEVMPSGSEKGRGIASRLVNANTCLPFSYQTGDALAWLKGLKNSGIKPAEQAVILEPCAKGPCRFGQYHVLLQKIIDNNGFNGVGILSPDAEKDYSNLPITDAQIALQAAWIFKGTYCMDLILDSLLRTRPYEKEKGGAESIYNEAKKELLFLIQKKASFKSIIALMNKTAENFNEMINYNTLQKPIVAVNGEIFVRLHNAANHDIIRLLEQYGLEVKLSPVSQWIEYINKNAIKLFRRSGNWKKFFISKLKKTYMDKTGAKLSMPFKNLLEKRPLHDSAHLINAVHKDLIYHKLIRGESALTIGETYMFAKNRLPEISGICHIWPFGCMHETAATSQINSFTGKQKKHAETLNEKVIPFIDAVFGETELPNLEAEIAVFAEKCYLKKKLQMVDKEIFN